MGIENEITAANSLIFHTLNAHNNYEASDDYTGHPGASHADKIFTAKAMTDPFCEKAGVRRRRWRLVY